MKFTWKPIKDLNSLPRGIEIFVCIENQYCEYIRRANTVDKNPDAWFYVYSNREIQTHKIQDFTHYFIPRPVINLNSNKHEPNPNLFERVPNNIQNILIRKDMTQKDLADLMQKAPEEINRYFSGKHNFTLKTISAIEKALGEKVI